ncbi:hypothetical protein WT83_13735 [Burkholderia territorii]|uniref:Uncharacterized protein n=1 Tax=Burkholderia territorii TaxID=1503055 RepID=A0A119VKN1_9BURK|nr:hypothetical protein WT83_13735 [Burkholderia territorii]
MLRLRNGKRDTFRNARRNRIARISFDFPVASTRVVAPPACFDRCTRAIHRRFSDTSSGHFVIADRILCHTTDCHRSRGHQR